METKLELNDKLIALDIGATNIKVGLFVKNENGLKIEGKVKLVPTKSNSYESILCQLEKAITLHIDKYVKAVAISSAGTIDSLNKNIIYATDNLPGMTGFDFQKYCIDRFNLPCEVINDAHAALLGEMYYGVGIGHTKEKVVMLTLGSGVGGAYFVNGKLVNNKENNDARFGHITLVPNGKKCTCGKNGCVEMYLSGRAIHSRASEINITDLFTDYLENKEEALILVNTLKNELNQILDKINKFCPFDFCILGGGVVNWIGKSFTKFTLHMKYKIVKAKLNNNAGVYGAVIHYLHQKNNNI